MLLNSSTSFFREENSYVDKPCILKGGDIWNWRVEKTLFF